MLMARVTTIYRWPTIKTTNEHSHLIDRLPKKNFTTRAKNHDSIRAKEVRAIFSLICCKMTDRMPIFFPHVGLGNLLIMKLRTLATGDKVGTIVFRERMVVNNRKNFKQAMVFGCWLLRKMYPKASIVTELPKDVQEYVDHHTLGSPPIASKIPVELLSDDIALYLPSELRNITQFIVFHTKIRAPMLTNNPGHLRQLATMFRTLRLPIPIVLIGERVIERNDEAVTHKVREFYKEMLAMADNEGNKVIDLTEDQLYSSNTIEGFLRDVAIIQGAVANVSLGYGGNTVLAKCFSKQLICLPQWQKKDVRIKVIKSCPDDCDRFHDTFHAFFEDICETVNSVIFKNN